MKLETIDEELPYVITQITPHEKLQEMIATPSDIYSEAEKLNDLKKIPMPLIQEVAEIYKDDFEMFDYRLPTTNEIYLL